MNITVSGEIWYWRGPSPFHFVTVPDEQCAELRAVSGLVTYGWGMIPVTARIDGTEWTTSLFPKNGGYIVPIKDRVRSANGLDVGDVVDVEIEVNSSDPGGGR